MKSFNADVCMMAYVLLFVPQPVLDAPKLGTFQYHPSLLPAHRGPSSINWPIAMGKTRTGLTIFWPNEGLDEGPILLQKTVEIGPDETLGDVYFKKLFPMGVDAMIEGLDLVRAGVKLKHTQNHAEGTYESWFKKDAGRDRLVEARRRDLQPDPRRQPGAGRLEHDQGRRRSTSSTAPRSPAAGKPGRGARHRRQGHDDRRQRRAPSSPSACAAADGKKIAAARVGEGRRRQGRRHVRQALHRKPASLNVQAVCVISQEGN